MVNPLAQLSPDQRTAQALEDWFDQQYGIDLQLPAKLRSDWDFAYLTRAYVAHLDGRKVPTLVFRKDEAQAEVLLLRRGQYRLSELAPYQDYSQRYPNQPRIVGDPAQDRYVALVFYEKGDYNTFRKPGTVPIGTLS